MPATEVNRAPALLPARMSAGRHVCPCGGPVCLAGRWRSVCWLECARRAVLGVTGQRGGGQWNLTQYRAELLSLGCGQLDSCPSERGL